MLEAFEWAFRRKLGVGRAGTMDSISMLLYDPDQDGGGRSGQGDLGVVLLKLSSFTSECDSTSDLLEKLTYGTVR